METDSIFFDKWWDGWKGFARQELKIVPNLISFVDSCGFSCDDLQSIIRWLEELHWSDYEAWFDDSDRSDELRDFRDGE